MPATICRISALLGLFAAGCASRSAHVADLAATGLAYDAAYIATPGGNIRVLEALQRRALWLGVTVEYRPEGHEDLMTADGLSFYDSANRRQILINGNLSVNGRIEVLAHEFGHLFQPGMGSRSDGEVFAEAVSIEACKRLGIDTTVAAARYLRGHKRSLPIVRIYRREVSFVADILTRGLR